MLAGDLLYLDLTTLEGQEYYITATPSGFFLNKSTNRENFDPTPRKTSHLHKHLVGLLSQISPLFKKNFALLQKFG
jgi:protein TIF31